MDAIILAGGLGTRLRSVVSEVPKCMAPVGGKPFLEVLVDAIVARGDVDRIVLSVGYLREVIFDWVAANRDRYPVTFDFAVETTPLGTGGGIKLALERCQAEEVFVYNGDTFFEGGFLWSASTSGGGSGAFSGENPSLTLPTVEAAGDSAEIQPAGVTIALKRMREFDRYGAVECGPGGIVTRFCEKKHCAEGLINAGVYLIRRSLLDLGALPEKFSFEKDVLEPLAAAGKLRAVELDGYFIDIGIPEDYALAQIRWSGARTLLLDRDGVINVLRPGDYVKSWDEWEFTPRFLELAPQWAALFERIFVVTNQRGVGKGLMSEAALEEIHRRMISAVEAAGGRIDGIYCCTAVSDDDPRRKPNTGMWDEIRRDHPDVTAASTIMVGDSGSDLAFAASARIPAVQLLW